MGLPGTRRDMERRCPSSFLRRAAEGEEEDERAGKSLPVTKAADPGTACGSCCSFCRRSGSWSCSWSCSWWWAWRWSGPAGDAFPRDLDPVGELGAEENKDGGRFLADDDKGDGCL